MRSHEHLPAESQATYCTTQVVDVLCKNINSLAPHLVGMEMMCKACVNVAVDEESCLMRLIIASSAVI